MPTFIGERRGQNGDRPVPAHGTVEVLRRAHTCVLCQVGAASKRHQRGLDAGLRGLVLMRLSRRQW
jgi:hypothetical protein